MNGYCVDNSPCLKKVHKLGKWLVTNKVIERIIFLSTL